MERESSVYILAGNSPFNVSGRLDCKSVTLLAYNPDGLGLQYCLIETRDGRKLEFDPGVVFNDEYSQIESQPDEIFDPIQKPDQLPIHRPPATLRINA